MEDWTAIVIVAVGILFSFFKAKFKDTDDPVFEEDDMPEEEPVIVMQQQQSAKKPKAPRPFIQPNKNNERKTAPIPSPVEQPTIEENNDDFQINSTEEARKAIIWGEILQRKHF